MRSVFALALLGSLIGCSSTSSLPTQTAYSVANIEQPQPVHFYCGMLVAVQPATINVSNEGGVGVTPRLGQWLLGLHAGSYGPGTAGIKVSGGFVDLIGIASQPNLAVNEYTVLLRTGTDPRDQTLSPAEPMAAVIVVQADEGQLAPGADVVVRVVGQSGRVMRSPFGGQCAGNFPWGRTASAGYAQIPPGGSSGLTDWQAYAAQHLVAVTPMPIPLLGAGYYPPVQDTAYHPHWNIGIW